MVNIAEDCIPFRVDTWIWVLCHGVGQSYCDRPVCSTCCEGAVADGQSHVQGVDERKDLKVLERFASLKMLILQLVFKYEAAWEFFRLVARSLEDQIREGLDDCLPGRDTALKVAKQVSGGRTLSWESGSALRHLQLDPCRGILTCWYSCSVHEANPDYEVSSPEETPELPHGERTRGVLVSETDSLRAPISSLEEHTSHNLVFSVSDCRASNSRPRP